MIYDSMMHSMILWFYDAFYIVEIVEFHESSSCGISIE